MNTYIAIIDYGMGNLRSVYKALESLGHKALITDMPEYIREASGIILPGVGAFGALVENITKKGLRDLLIEQIMGGKPYLGICLGLQVLFEKSYENGEYEGLGIFPGEVIQFSNLPPALKIPHMGWNSLTLKKDIELLKGVDNGEMFYFVHSYHVVPTDSSLTATSTTYGYEFTSSAGKDNVFGVQFHPEKSGSAGLTILNNFARLCGKGK